MTLKVQYIEDHPIGSVTVVYGTRQSGKTELLLTQAANYALGHPGSKIAYVVDNYAMGECVQDRITQKFSYNVSTNSKASRVVRFYNGSAIYMLTPHSKGHGFNPDALYVDDAELITKPLTFITLPGVKYVAFSVNKEQLL